MMNKEIKVSLGILFVGLAMILLYWFFVPQNTDNISDTTKPQKEVVILPKHLPQIYQDIPQVQEYIFAMQKMYNSGKSVLPLESSELDDEGMKAQDIILHDVAFLEDTKQDGKIVRNEMMRVLPVLVSTVSAKNKLVCQTTTCYQAEKYNFVTNTTTRAIIDVENKKVLSIKRYPNMQPDISQRLKNIAQAIALHAPEVKDALGETPSRKDISMANVRGALQESPCENSAHLCVAPTFSDYKKEQALWAVIDLTDLKLVAAKWAGLGKTTTPACISERSLQNRYIMENYCQKDTHLSKNGWDITYRLTGSDGLEIRDVKFKGNPVLTSAKIVDWHVSYKQKGGEGLDTTTTAYIDEREIEFVREDGGDYLFGYNDAMGCPMFSTSVVLPFNGPQVRELNTSKGFMLSQDFRNPKWPMACNYRYENRFEFYNDGSFRVVGVNKGRGCGDNAIYRPVMRIDMAVATQENFYSFNGAWNVWEKEASELVDNTSSYPYKIVSAQNSENGYYIEPNHGQFLDASRGDNATLFVTKFNLQEGDQDLLTLGSCCNLKEDGVERYIENNESIRGQDIVLWYVPRIRNDAREGHEYCWADTRLGNDGNLHVKVWPCIVGPKFVPISKR
jgi:hypothetical protein